MFAVVMFQMGVHGQWHVLWHRTTDGIEGHCIFWYEENAQSTVDWLLTF